MNKATGLFLFFFAFVFWSFGQNNEILWSGEFNKSKEAIVLKAKLKEGWHVYSQHVNPEAGPIPTDFEFYSDSKFDLKGEVLESEVIEAYDVNFQSNVLYFEKEAIFVQQIENYQSGMIECLITFMICNDQMCYPPEEKIITVVINE